MYGIVTDELGDDEILLSFADMLEWGLLSPNFPQVPKMKKEKAKKMKITAKKTKEKVRKKNSSRKKKKDRPIVNIVPTGRDLGDNIGVSPVRDCGSKGSTK